MASIMISSSMELLLTGGTSGLNDEDVHSPHILVYLDPGFSVAERGYIGFPKDDSQLVTDFLRQIRIGVPGNIAFALLLLRK